MNECECDFENDTEMCDFCNKWIHEIKLNEIIIKQPSQDILNDLDQLCNILEMNKNQKECALKIFFDLNKRFKGDRRRHVFINCIYYAMIMTNSPRTVNELCTIYQIDIRDFRKCNKVLKHVETMIPDSFLGIFYRLTKQFDIPKRYMYEMDNLMKECIHLLDISFDKACYCIFIYVATEIHSYSFDDRYSTFNVSKYLYMNTRKKIEKIRYSVAT